MLNLFLSVYFEIYILMHSSMLLIGIETLLKLLTHLSLASHKRDIGKQCRPRSDATERGVCPGGTLFPLNTGMYI